MMVLLLWVSLSLLSTIVLPGVLMLSLLQLVLYKWSFLLWVFCAFNFGSAYRLMVGIALRRHTIKNNVKQLPIYPAQFQMQWR